MKKLSAIPLFWGAVFMAGLILENRCVAGDNTSPGSLTLENGDMNGDGTIDVSDGIYLLSYLYLGGPAPEPIACGAIDPMEGIHLLLDADGSGASTSPDAVAEIQWDLISIGSFAPVTVNAGGKASARANDGSKITVTGSGTIRAAGNSQNVSGGGTWETFDSGGTSTGSGTYTVKKLISFDEAPGSQAAATIDNIGDKADARAGLMFVKIAYSDGSEGNLVVSCHQQVGSPDTIFEGITASKGFVDYWNREAPVGGVDGDRTIFHVLVPKGSTSN